jgi:hypothetical protein
LLGLLVNRIRSSGVGRACVIHVSCPECGREREFADVLGGLTVVCTNCGHRIPVPASRQQAPPAGNAITSAPKAMSSQALTAPLPPRPSEEGIQPARGETPPASPAVSLEIPEVRSIVNDPSSSSPLPDWAAEYASAALRVGQSVECH